MVKKPFPGSSTIDRGHLAEARALGVLEAKGFRLVERNFRWRGGEIDLVALDGRTLVFIEVRSAAERSRYLRYSISPAKRRRLVATAARYRLARAWSRAVPARFDLVWVEGDRLEHWPNVLL